MEPVTTIAAAAVGILTPYVAKAGEEFAKAAGKEVYEKAKKLFTYVKAKFSGNEDAAATLNLYEKKPERYEAALKGLLVEELEKDSKFAAELSAQLREIGPCIEVIQKMKKGEGVTGLELDQMASGKAHVRQDIDEGLNVTGVHIKKIG